MKLVMLITMMTLTLGGTCLASSSQSQKDEKAGCEQTNAKGREISSEVVNEQQSKADKSGDEDASDRPYQHIGASERK